MDPGLLSWNPREVVVMLEGERHPHSMSLISSELLLRLRMVMGRSWVL